MLLPSLSAHSDWSPYNVLCLKLQRHAGNSPPVSVRNLQTERNERVTTTAITTADLRTEDSKQPVLDTVGRPPVPLSSPPAQQTAHRAADAQQGPQSTPVVAHTSPTIPRTANRTDIATAPPGSALHSSRRFLTLSDASSLTHLHTRHVRLGTSAAAYSGAIGGGLA